MFFLDVLLHDFDCISRFKVKFRHYPGENSGTILVKIPALPWWKVRHYPGENSGTTLVKIVALPRYLYGEYDAIINIRDEPIAKKRR